MKKNSQNNIDQETTRLNIIQKVDQLFDQEDEQDFYLKSTSQTMTTS